MTIPPLPLYIDSTMMGAFVSCPRKFFNEFILGLRKKDISIDLHCGGCVSHAFETAYNLIHTDKLSFEAMMLRVQAQFEMDWGNVEPPSRIGARGQIIYASAKTKERTWDAIVDYFQKYPPLSDHIQPLHIGGRSTIEFTFAIPLTKDTLGYEVPRHPSGDPFLYSGRLDFLGQWGKITLPLDHKTAGKADNSWTEKWDLRSQFMGYVWACGQLGIDVQRHFAVRGIIIMKEEIRQLEAIKSYPDELIERWKAQLARNIHRLHDCYTSGYFDYDFYEACTQYGMCPYFHACRAANPDVWLKDFVPRFWNPLEKNPVAGTPPPTDYVPSPPFTA